MQCADRGDAVAQSVLAEQGRELAHLVCLLVERIRSESPDMSFEPKLAFAGSIMEKVVQVREALIASVQTQYPEAKALDGVVDPVEGALWRARSVSPLS